MSKSTEKAPLWYEGKHQETVFYLLLAVFFLELIIGGVAFFYGIIHARPEVAGGPPIARFPWLYWALAAVLGPVALLLIVHLSGLLISSTINRDNSSSEVSGDQELPERMRRFYAFVRHAPTVVILVALLLLGAVLFFVDGAFTLLQRLFENLVPHLPWLAGSLAALLAVCFIAHAIMVYRQRKLENEYAWRREVLEKTGLVITDKNSYPLSVEAVKQNALSASQAKAELPEGKVIEIKAAGKDSEENET